MPVNRSLFQKLDGNGDGVLSAEETVLHELFPKGQRVQVTGKAKKGFSHSKFVPGDKGIVLEAPEDEWARNCFVLFDDGDSQKVCLKYIAPIFMNDDGEEVVYGALKTHERERGKRVQGTVGIVEEGGIDVGAVALEEKRRSLTLLSDFGASQKETIVAEVVAEEVVAEEVVAEEVVAEEVVEKEVVEQAVVEESNVGFGGSHTGVNVEESAVERNLVSGASQPSVDLQYVLPQQITICENSGSSAAGQDRLVEEVVAADSNLVFGVGAPQEEKVAEEATGTRNLMSGTSQEDHNLQYGALQQTIIGGEQPEGMYECCVGDEQFDEGMQYSINATGYGVVDEVVAVGRVVAGERNLVFGASQLVAANRDLVFGALQGGVAEEVVAGSRDFVFGAHQGGVDEEAIAENRNWVLGAGKTNLMAGTPEAVEVVEEVVAVDRSLVDDAPVNIEIVEGVVFGASQEGEIVEDVAARNLGFGTSQQGAHLQYDLPQQAMTHGCGVQPGTMCEYVVEGVQLVEGTEYSGNPVGHGGVVEEVVAGDENLACKYYQGTIEQVVVEERDPVFCSPQTGAGVEGRVAVERNLVFDLGFDTTQKQEIVEQIVAGEGSLVVGASQQEQGGISQCDVPVGVVRSLEDMQYSTNAGGQAGVIEEIVAVDRNIVYGAPQKHEIVQEVVVGERNLLVDTPQNGESVEDVEARRLEFGTSQQGAQFGAPEQARAYGFGGEVVEGMQYSSNLVGQGGAVAEVVAVDRNLVCGAPQNQGTVQTGMNVAGSVAVERNLVLGAGQQGVELQHAVPQQTMTFEYGFGGVQQDSRQSIQHSGYVSGQGCVGSVQPSQGVQYNGCVLQHGGFEVQCRTPQQTMRYNCDARINELKVARMGMVVPQHSSPVTETTVTEVGGNTAPLPWYSMPQQTTVTYEAYSIAGAVTVAEVGGHTAPLASAKVTYEAPSYSMPTAEAVTVTEVGGNTAPFPSTMVTCGISSYSMPIAQAAAVTEAGVNTASFPSTMVTCEAPLYSMSPYSMAPAKAVTVKETRGNTAPLLSYSMPIAETVAYSMPVAGAIPVVEASVTAPLMCHAAIAGVAVTEGGVVTKSVTKSEDCVRTRELETSGMVTSEDSVKFRAVCAAPAVRAVKVTSPCETVPIALATVTPSSKAGKKGQASSGALTIRARVGRSCCG